MALALSYTVGASSPTNLWQLVQDYTSNTETSFVTNIPTFVRLAESRIALSIDVPSLPTSLVVNLVSGQSSVTVAGATYPFLSTISYIVYPTASVPTNLEQTGTYLINREPEYIYEAFGLNGTGYRTGMPRYYARLDQSTVVIGPVSDASYYSVLRYYTHPDSIVTASSSWIGSSIPDLLLYGTIREAYAYMKGEPDLVQLYDQKYQDALMMSKSRTVAGNRRDDYTSGRARGVG